MGVSQDDLTRHPNKQKCAASSAVRGMSRPSLIGMAHHSGPGGRGGGCQPQPMRHGQGGVQRGAGGGGSRTIIVSGFGGIFEVPVPF